jgi:hypothetical protein
MSAQSTASEFEADRQPHLRAFADRLPAEAERLTWPLERLHGLRDERLRVLLRTAKARSPWHGKRLAGIDVDAVTGADLAAIPTMTKTDVMEHWDEIVTDHRRAPGRDDRRLERQTRRVRVGLRGLARLRARTGTAHVLAATSRRRRS